MSKEKNKKPEEIEETEEKVENHIAPNTHKRKKNHWGHGSEEKRKIIRSYKSPGRK